MEAAGMLIFVAIAFGAYLLPWIVAATRNHHQADAIGILTLFGGWTGIGWLVALVWACTAVREDLRWRPRAVAHDEPEEIVIAGRKNCTNCGAPAARSSRFCGSCGAQL